MVENEAQATCTVDGGYDTVIRCTECNEVVSSVHTTTEALGHTTGPDAEENRVEATSTTHGGYDMVARCTVCNGILTSESFVLHYAGEDKTENYVESTSCTHLGGYDTVNYCTVDGCGAELARKRTHLAVPHDFVDGACTVCQASDGFEYELDDENSSCKITGVDISVSGSDIVVPYIFTHTNDKVYKVEGIYISGSTAGLNGVVSAVVQDGVTLIGRRAFHSVSTLKTLVLPNSITELGQECLRETSITELHLGDNVTVIGSGAFYYCSKLVSVTISSNVTSIGSLAFEGCTSLESVVISNGVKEIGKSAFLGCTKLKDIVIPDSVISIGESAFSDCTGLTSVTIGSGVTSIGDSVFSGCSALASIEVDKDNQSFKTIDGCLYNKDGTTLIQYPVGNTATSIVLPDGVTTINANAFRDCTSLVSIEIPNGLTTIGSNAFRGCTSLKSIVIPDSVTSIGTYAFYDCTALESVKLPSGITKIGNYTFYNCKKLTSIEIPDGVTTIGTYVFRYCTALESIVLPASVTSIGASAFRNCSAFTTVYYSGTPEQYAQISVSSTQNTSFNNATVYYYSLEQPTDAGNYWHYVDGVITKWPAV